MEGQRSLPGAGQPGSHHPSPPPDDFQGRSRIDDLDRETRERTHQIGHRALERIIVDGTGYEAEKKWDRSIRRGPLSRRANSTREVRMAERSAPAPSSGVGRMEEANDAVDLERVRADAAEARGHDYRRKYASRQSVAHLEAQLGMVDEIGVLDGLAAPRVGVVRG